MWIGSSLPCANGVAARCPVSASRAGPSASRNSGVPSMRCISSPEGCWIQMTLNCSGWIRGRVSQVRLIDGLTVCMSSVREPTHLELGRRHARESEERGIEFGHLFRGSALATDMVQAKEERL